MIHNGFSPKNKLYTYGMFIFQLVSYVRVCSEASCFNELNTLDISFPKNAENILLDKCKKMHWILAKTSHNCYIVILDNLSIIVIQLMDNLLLDYLMHLLHLFSNILVILVCSKSSSKYFIQIQDKNKLAKIQ